jgi:hypothetical protein
MSVSLTGNDTLILSKLGAQDRVLKDFGDGDVANIGIPNNLVEMKSGKDGNAIIAYNASGKQTIVTLRLLRGSADDKFLNSEISSYENNRPGYILLTGEFIKRSGDGKGNITNDIYKFSNGIVQKYPESKENADGDTEQALSIYNLIFSRIDRIIA